MRKHYVLGLVFNSSQDTILLIEKIRPDWQKGRWNGIGGKIKEGETPLEAMERESIEETGFIHPYQHRITFICPGGTVFVFSAKCSHPRINFNQIEDEILQVWPLDNLPGGIMANMRWIIPLSLASLQFPIMINQLCLGVDG